MEINDKLLDELIDTRIAAKEADKPKEEPVDVKALVAEGVEDALKKLPAIMQDVKITKDEADQDFENPGEFFQAVKTAALYPGMEDVRLTSLKATGLSENVPADGGYLLSPQVAAGIIDKMYNTTPSTKQVEPMDPALVAYWVTGQPRPEASPLLNPLFASWNSSSRKWRLCAMPPTSC